MEDEEPEQGGGTLALAQQRARLREIPFFQGMEPDLIDSLASEFAWMVLPGGATLFNQGDTATALFLVVYGRLSASVEDESGSRIIAHIGAGEVVGEMGLISGNPRSATITALRDCELFRLDKAIFESFVSRHPQALLFIAQQLTTRLLATTRRAPMSDAPATVMVAPALPGAPARELAEGLATGMRSLGEMVLVLDADSAEGRESEWFHSIEFEHDRILYVADFDRVNWTQRCLRQCDRILLVARCDEKPPEGPLLPPYLRPRLTRPMELVLVEETAGGAVRGAGEWLERLPFELHCHIHLGNPADLLRLARLLLRRAIGIVLSGGGARGLAHVGAIRALREAGVAIDLLGGTSIGAIVAAMVALGWDDRQLAELTRENFATTKPFKDFTLPFISLARGRKVSAMLRGVFEEHRIENTRLPFFCVSTNLTRGEVNVHRSGLLRMALRASIALPGLLPPVVQDGEVFVDGAMLANFPSDVLSQMRRGPVIGCDVARAQGLRSLADSLDERSLWWLLRQSRSQAPSIMSILMSAGTVSSAAQAQQCRLHTDVLLEPPLADFSLLDWQGYERAMEAGYRYTAELLEKPENRSLLGLDG